MNVLMCVYFVLSILIVFNDYEHIFIFLLIIYHRWNHKVGGGMYNYNIK